MILLLINETKSEYKSEVFREPFITALSMDIAEFLNILLNKAVKIFNLEIIKIIFEFVNRISQFGTLFLKQSEAGK